MQSRLAMYIAAAAATLFLGAIFLATRDIPAPQQPVEKQLDAKAFLSAKP